MFVPYEELWTCDENVAAGWSFSHSWQQPPLFSHEAVIQLPAKIVPCVSIKIVQIGRSDKKSKQFGIIRIICQSKNISKTEVTFTIEHV